MAEVEIPYGDKVIRLRIDVVSVLSKTPATAPTTMTATRPVLKPKV